MNHDPQGYYARLELDWDAPSEAVHAAYRRKARVLHPDIPVTGNAAAFVALKEAYDVLADPLRRAAYERAARSLDHLRANVHAAQEHHPAPPSPPPPSAPTRGPRLSDLPIGVWAILAMVVVFAGVEAALHLFAPPAQDQVVNVPPTAPTVPPETPPPPPAPIRLFGTPNVYVIPAGGPALVLRYDSGRLAFVPIGQLPAFSAAQATRVLRANGLVEIRLTNTSVGFIDAARLAPGNLVAAHQAYCAYNAGPPPANGEILDRAGAGTGKTSIENRSGQPLVVKLRDRIGVVAATVFLAPGGDATVDGLPSGAYRPDFAMGELWSRVCNMFAAGMRAQRFAGYTDLSALDTLVIPPDLPGQPPPVDISDQEFAHD
jgi:DnaJ domain